MKAMTTTGSLPVPRLIIAVIATITLLSSLPTAYCLLPTSRASELTDVVRIELKADAKAQGPNVTIGDVATISGGPALLQRQIAKLDIAELSSSGKAVNVTRTQVEFRLKLADVPASLYRIEGANEIVVKADRPGATPTQIVDAARAALMKRLPWSADDVSVRLIQPVTATLPAGAPSDIRIAAELRNAEVSAGRVQVDVSVSERGEKRMNVPVYFDVRPLRTVAVCKVAVARGKAITQQDVAIERRPVETTAQTAEPECVVGAVARRMIKTGDVVASADLEETAASPVVVKCKQPVKMIVHLGAMNVVAGGEALQDGRVGQLIRVQNTESKKVVTGRVTANGIVEVE